MSDLIPIAIFVGCMLATFGLLRLCEWLRPPAASTTHRADQAGAIAANTRHEGAAP